jgi:PAS domain S-box-containing protein
VQDIAIREIALSSFLRQHRAPILDAWTVAVRAEMSEASRLSTPALLDHIPHFLEELAAHADGSSSPAHPEIGAAEHAVQRLEQGYDLERIAHEYGLLRSVLLARLRTQHLALAPLDLERLNEAIDFAIRDAAARLASAERRVLGAIDRVSTAADGTTDVREMLSRLMRVFVDAAAPVDVVMLLLREDRHLRVRASLGLEEYVRIGYMVPIGQGFTGTIAKTGQAMALDDATHDPMIHDEAFHRHGFRGLYGVPLLHRGQVIGVAFMGSRSAPTFSEEQKVLFRAMTSHATTLIALMLAITRERAASLAARAFAKAATAEQAMAQLLGRIGDAFQWDIGSYWRVDAEAGVLRHQLSWAANPQQADVLEALTTGFVFARGEGMPGRAWESGAVEWVMNIAEDARLPRKVIAAGMGLRSGIAFPVLDDSGVLGVLEFFSGALRPLGDQAMEMTAAIRQQLPEFLRRIRAQENQRRSDALRSAMLDVAIDCIVSMDARGILTSWNPAAARTFGYSADEAIGREVADLIIPPELRDAHRAGLARYLESGEHHYLDRRLEVPAVRRDGTRITVELAITRVTGESPPLFTGFLRDITAEKQAATDRARLHQQAEEASRARDMMLGIVSHDLRNPMAAIMAAAGVLQQQIPANADPSARRSLETIMRASTRVDRLIMDLLDTTSIHSGRLSIVRSPQFLAGLVCDATELHRPAAVERGIELTCDGVSPEVEGNWDGDRIHQVLSNLIGNAIKFCRPGAAVRVRTGIEGSNAVIEVADTGPGIAPSELPRIFEPYWTRRRTSTDAGGTGLGLFISKGIVEAHGGRLTVESEPGGGATFRFTLPLSA